MFAFPPVPRLLRLGLIAAAVPLFLGALRAPARPQATVPTGFADELILGGLDNPVGIAFLPDGRLLFVEQVTANVRLVVNGGLSAVDPVLTVPNVNITGGEQGLLGIAVDPGWPSRPYIYVQYDHTGNLIWISRYTVGGDVSFTGNGALTIDPASRYDILTDLPDDQTNHNGGTLRFGPDGMLYSSLGDDASGCPALDLTVLVGKILRLNVAGLQVGPGGPPAKSAITPADNPFVANVNANAKLVCYSGLRNPFRFAIDPQNGNVAIGDVGEVTQEEIDFVSVRGSNFEWPVREGLVAGPPSINTCTGVDMSRFTDPVYVLGHPNRIAIIGGPIYRWRPGVHSFPAGYDTDIFLSEYYSGLMRRLHGGGTSWALAPAPGQPNATDWATGLIHVSDYLVGSTGAVWYCKQSSLAYGARTGEIRRIIATGGTTGPAISAVNASPGASTCAIGWVTDVASTSRVDYGSSPGTLDLNAQQPAMVTNHGVLLAGLTPSTTYYFRVTSDDGTASSTFPDPGTAPRSFTTLAMPSSLRMGDPFPSPAVGSATIPYDLDRDAVVTMSLHGPRGQLVRTLVDGESRPAGPQSEVWDGRDNDGHDAPAGIYFVRLEVGGERKERRFALIR